MAPVLEIKNLSLRIGGTDILKDVDLSLPKGEITGLVGRSGSGKSMTALALMGLAPWNAEIFGEVLLDGENLLDKSDAEMSALRGSQIAMVFQEPMTALNPLQTIGAQVAESFLIHQNITQEEAEQKAAHILKRAGLPSEEIPPDRYPHELSGGQRQRVVIAIAAAMEPKVLIADEPTTALDVTTQAEILKLLRTFADEDGIAILLITHDLAVMSENADRIAVMENGTASNAVPAQDFFQSRSFPDLDNMQPAPIRRAPVNEDTGRPVLRASKVCCDYAGDRSSLFSKPEMFRAVDDVSFEIKRGEILGLVGESGCGKSTLARALLGLHPLAAGEISINGGGFPAADKARLQAMRRDIQIVFQDPYSSFNPRWRVDRIIAEPFQLFEQTPSPEERRERARQALASVGLAPRQGDKYPHEFSGGQRQRIALARALVREAPILLLDEATSALDSESERLVQKAISTAAEGRTTLVIAHRLSTIRRADRIVVMDKGGIVEQGTHDALVAQGGLYARLAEMQFATQASERPEISSVN